MLADLRGNGPSVEPIRSRTVVPTHPRYTILSVAVLPNFCDRFPGREFGHQLGLFSKLLAVLYAVNHR